VSRAVRTPTRVERDLFVEAADPSGDLSARLSGNRNLKAEELTSFELGYRVQPATVLYVDVATFYNVYGNLVTQEVGTPFSEGANQTMVFPVTNQNEMHGEAYGGEVALDWVPLKFWRLGASYSAAKVDLRTEPGSNDTVSPLIENASPMNQVQLRSFLDLPESFELDSLLR
jgi:iron complex outermembrane receptor protein